MAKTAFQALDLLQKPSRPFSINVKTNQELLYTREVVLEVL